MSSRPVGDVRHNPIVKEGEPSLARADPGRLDSDSLYRDIVESAQEGIWITNAELVTTFVNSRVATLLDYKIEEIVGRKLPEFIEPPAREAVQALMESLPSTVTGQQEVRIARHDGSVIFAVLELRALFSSAREFKGVRASVVDITPRRIAEERLRQSDAQLAQAQALARMGTWEWDLDSDEMTGSPELRALLGIGPMNGRSFGEAMSVLEIEGRERVVSQLRAAATGDEPVEYTLVVRTPAGKRRVMHARAQRLCDSAGRPCRVVGIIQDVTEQMHLTERLRQAERVSSLGRLAASVAHEFNNILMGIQPFAEVILRSPAISEGLRNAATRIADGVARGKRVTQEILRFTRTPAPAVSVVEVAGWLATSYTDLVQLAGADVTISIEAEGSMRMLADGQQLRQVLANFVTNARDAMPRGGTVTIRAARREGRRAGDVEEYVHFAVTDNGNGMPPETLRLAFEPLFTTKPVGGTGLGLSIAQNIVQAQGGEIWAESTLGQGSTFHVLIPAAAGLPPVAPAAASTPARRTSNIRRIVLVEDDHSVAAGLAAVLALEGIEVQLVERGEGAMARIEEVQPDAVVLDVGLPDIDGITLYAAISGRWPSLPVIFSTGNADEKMLAPLTGATHVDYLLKPYDTEALLEKLHVVVGSKLPSS
jgi:PAS domain S-box-containing protein